jgi:hypothetical protein
VATDGPFKGMKGTVVAVDAERHALKTSMKIYGRETPIELHFDDARRPWGASGRRPTCDDWVGVRSPVSSAAIYRRSCLRGTDAKARRGDHRRSRGSRPRRHATAMNRREGRAAPVGPQERW